MAGTARCMSCMRGTIVNGRCTHCGRPPVPPGERRADALPLGLKLHGRYWIGDVLGRGGFGITYAAWDEREDRRVVVKELYPCMDLSRAPDRCTVQVRDGQEEYFAQVSRCFTTEVKSLIELQQDGVVQFYHLFGQFNTMYYVMEYLDGQDLHTILGRDGPMSWKTLAPILKTVLTALSRLHERGFIHRDISPDNIFITREGQARLIDFGSVRTFQGNHSFTTFIKQSFAPLEQYKTHGKQGPWTDVYALCVTAYYALTGKLPPVAPERRIEDTTVPIRQLCPRLPAHVAAAITRGMCVSVEGRCQSAGELEAMLFPRAPAQGGCTLACVAGRKRGQSWQLVPGRCMTLGRQDCSILYPSEATEISRRQCSVLMDDRGQVMARDEGGRNPVFCQGVRLTPGTWYRLRPGYVLVFAHEQYTIRG